jgi:ferredoxin--NADP+ reductase|tara:strand:+ start:10429 stop:11214 length:786 start_codon:yes stop_codon:yes gene_type:complete
MAILELEVLKVQHYTDDLFHFTIARDPGLRFRDGEFVMIGLNNWSEKLQKNKPIMRAYSVASPNHQDTIEFYSIKVQDGPLTSRLQHVVPGDKILVNDKAVGTLVNANIKPGRNLYLLATGTGVAPFLSLARGVDTYEYYDNVILVWGARTVAELPFDAMFRNLNEDEIYQHVTEGKFKFYPTVTRQSYENEGRVTTAMYDGKVQEALDLPMLDPEHDRIMICGSIPMNEELIEWLEVLGFEEGNNKYPGTYVVERAFVSS